jgi:hypothetical protein
MDSKPCHSPHPILAGIQRNTSLAHSLSRPSIRVMFLGSSLRGMSNVTLQDKGENHPPPTKLSVSHLLCIPLHVQHPPGPLSSWASGYSGIRVNLRLMLLAVL